MNWNGVAVTKTILIFVSSTKLRYPPSTGVLQTFDLQTKFALPGNQPFRLAMARGRRGYFAGLHARKAETVGLYNDQRTIRQEPSFFAFSFFNLSNPTDYKRRQIKKIYKLQTHTNS